MTERHPNLNTMIHDGEYTKVIFPDRGQPFSQKAFIKRFDKLLVIQELQVRTTLEAAQVTGKDTASAQKSFVTTPCKDTLVVRGMNDLQLKTVKHRLPLLI